MNKTFKTLVAPIALLGLLALPSLAHADTNKTVNERQARQEDRIRDGERSGQLTRQEASDLQARVARIRTQETYARRSGGRLTDEERRNIQNQLDKVGSDIDRQKHDSQNRDNTRSNGGSYNGYNGTYNNRYQGNINNRQYRQQGQIWKGQRNGSLTEREAADLRARQARIRTQEQYNRRSGGQLSPAERARLQRELNAQHRDIKHQTHDRQHR